MKKSEHLLKEIKRLKREIDDVCLEDLEHGVDSSNITREIEAKVKRLHAEMLEAIEEEKPKPPPGYRAYTLQEAYDVFGHRSYTDVQIREAFERHFDWEADNYEGSPVFEYQIDGIIISSGEIVVRIHQSMESSDYHYVSLDDLVINYIWPDGTPCGVKIE